MYNHQYHTLFCYRRYLQRVKQVVFLSTLGISYLFIHCCACILSITFNELWSLFCPLSKLRYQIYNDINITYIIIPQKSFSQSNVRSINVTEDSHNKSSILCLRFIQLFAIRISTWNIFVLFGIIKYF